MGIKVIFNYILLLLFLIGGLLEATSPKESNSSIYESSFTSISQKDCQTLESDNLGSIEECESFAGIKVVLIEGDTKQSIILTRDNKRYELNFGSLVSQGFISLNSDLEWLYNRQEFDNPLSMIIGLEVDEDSGDVEKTISYYLISKITEKDICVVGKIKTKNSNDKLVHEMAKKANQMPCISVIK